MQDKINCLNLGYVKYVDHMGSDLSFTRAARASYAKEVDEWNEKEEKLLNFLVREGHLSVFRHAAVTLQVKSPLMVARQHFKYQVSSAHIDDQNGWNESSRRYVTQEPEFYIPDTTEWRSAPENSKQGSGANLPEHDGLWITSGLQIQIEESVNRYNQALSDGVAVEQARLFLPSYAMYVNYQWTVSVANLVHFLQERLAHDAQKEIQIYAQAIRDLVKPLYPATFKAFEL